MKSKILLNVVIVVALVIFTFAVQAESKDIIDNSRELFKQIQLFADSVTLISTDYVEPVKAKDLVYGAIRGMMNTLDGYSQFLDPDSFKEITEETKGEFGGIGIEIGVRDNVLTVIAPMEDTPAFEAGIQAGDKIVKISDEITSDMTLTEAVKIMRGEAGTPIKITVVREGVQEMLDFTIIRAIIKLKSIKNVKIIEDDIGYIRLLEFQQRTAKDLKKSIEKLKKNGARKLILDLRNNPGGLLDVAVETGELFFDKGVLIVSTEGRDSRKNAEFRAKRDSDFNDMELIILVNKGSASAAEILAGAVKDNKRGIIVGTTTFGKGSVQMVIPLNDKSALRLTTAAYFTPSGKNLMDKGVEPDVVIEKAKKEKSEIKKEEGAKEESVKEPTPEEIKAKEEKKKEFWKHDEQIQAAMNVFKGIEVSEKEKI